MKKNKASGFTLIETGISLLMLSGVLYLVAQQTGLFTKIQMKASYDVELQEASRKIEVALADPQTCTNFVAGTTLGYIEAQAKSSGGTRSNVYYDNSARIGQAIGGEIHGPLMVPQASIGETSQTSIDHTPQIVAQEDTKITTQLKVNSLQLVNDGVKNFIRVTFVPIGAAAGYGMRINRDFLITSKQNTSQQIVSCSLGPETTSSLHCRGLLDHQWNSATQKCEVISRLKRARTMVEVYASPAGGMMIENLVASSTVLSCLCSTGTCSKNPDCRCNVGSCPSGQRLETPSRRVSVVSNKLFKSCQMQAQCYDVIPIPPSTVPLGYIVGP